MLTTFIHRLLKINTIKGIIVVPDISVDVAYVRISDPDTVKSRQQQSVTNLSLSTLPDVVALNTNSAREKRTEIADANVVLVFLYMMR